MEQLVSVIVPMFNEEENAPVTLAALGAAFEARGWAFELIPVNDGSLDSTADVLASLAEADERIHPVTYTQNRGRGYALRQGFAAAMGTHIVTLDADLSYTPDHGVRMVDMLLDDPEVDMVVASPYMPGGNVEGVPFVRLLVSRLGNVVLRYSLPIRIYTNTGVARAYQAHVPRSLDLASDGKEIHLEILSDAISLGYRIVEMPATLRARKKGHSKFRPKATMVSHLAFSLLERASWILAIGGAILLLLSAIIGVFLLAQYLTGSLNPERPLMTVMVILFLGGTLGLSFSLLSLQIHALRRTVVRLQSDVIEVKRSSQNNGSSVKFPSEN